jgi:hypothetical protein
MKSSISEIRRKKKWNSRVHKLEMARNDRSLAFHNLILFEEIGACPGLNTNTHKA